QTTGVEPAAKKGRTTAAPKRSRGGRARSTYRRDERLRTLRDALRAASQGDFSVRVPTEDGDDRLLLEVARAYNACIEQSDALVRELHRVAFAVEYEGDVRRRASLGPVGGSWA